MNIKIGADELIYHLRKNDKCKEIDDITLGKKYQIFLRLHLEKNLLYKKMFLLIGVIIITP